MGWFSKKEPEPDPIGDICRLLVERLWEWSAFRQRVGDRFYPVLAHGSGVELSWDDRDVWLGVSGSVRIMQSRGDSKRLRAAIQQYMATLAKSPPRTLDDTAAALVKAYTAGGDTALDAALRLADHIFEMHGGTKREGT